MRTIPLAEAKAKLSSLLDAVEGRDEEIVITCNGRAAAVLVSLADFESWKETATVRADADLISEIRRERAAIKRGKAKLYTLEEFSPTDATRSMTRRLRVPSEIMNLCGGTSLPIR